MTSKMTGVLRLFSRVVKIADLTFYIKILRYLNDFNIDIPERQFESSNDQMRHLLWLTLTVPTTIVGGELGGSGEEEPSNGNLGGKIFDISGGTGDRDAETTSHDHRRTQTK